MYATNLSSEFSLSPKKFLKFLLENGFNEPSRERALVSDGVKACFWFTPSSVNPDSMKQEKTALASSFRPKRVLSCLHPVSQGRKVASKKASAFVPADLVPKQAEDGFPHLAILCCSRRGHGRPRTVIIHSRGTS